MCVCVSTMTAKQLSLSYTAGENHVTTRSRHTHTPTHWLTHALSA